VAVWLQCARLQKSVNNIRQMQVGMVQLAREPSIRASRSPLGSESASQHRRRLDALQPLVLHGRRLPPPTTHYHPRLRTRHFIPLNSTAHTCDNASPTTNQSRVACRKAQQARSWPRAQAASEARPGGDQKSQQNNQQLQRRRQWPRSKVTINASKEGNALGEPVRGPR